MLCVSRCCSKTDITAMLLTRSLQNTPRPATSTVSSPGVSHAVKLVRTPSALAGARQALRAGQYQHGAALRCASSLNGGGSEQQEGPVSALHALSAFNLFNIELEQVHSPVCMTIIRISLSMCMIVGCLNQTPLYMHVHRTTYSCNQ